jgi:hypothetical protein
MLAVGWSSDTRVMGAVASISPHIGGQVRLLLRQCFPSSDFLGYDSCGIHVWFESATYPMVVDAASVVAAPPTD